MPRPGPAASSWRRWTGIEPAGRGSPVPPALKAGEPTRRSDTSSPLRDPVGQRTTIPHRARPPYGNAFTARTRPAGAFLRPRVPSRCTCGCQVAIAYSQPQERCLRPHGRRNALGPGDDRDRSSGAVDGHGVAVTDDLGGVPHITTAGMPNSRATVAACDSTPPVSTTTAPAGMKSGAPPRSR